MHKRDAFTECCRRNILSGGVWRLCGSKEHSTAGCTNPLAKAATTSHARRAIMSNPMHPSQDTSPFCSEVEFAEYEEDTGLLGYRSGAPSSTVPQWLTPVAIFTLAATVMISAMPAVVVQYLVFAILFSAPAVGVVAFFATQGVDSSDYCACDWTPVVQTSSRFVVRGGEIPFEVVQPSPMLHLMLLAMALAGLAVMYRLVTNFVRVLRRCHTGHSKLRREKRTTSTCERMRRCGRYPREGPSFLKTSAMAALTPMVVCSSASTSLTSRTLAIGTESHTTFFPAPF
jgi:hypothetical protein